MLLKLSQMIMQVMRFQLKQKYYKGCYKQKVFIKADGKETEFIIEQKYVLVNGEKAPSIQMGLFSRGRY